ncbi:hypothetical protein A2U01_0082964, partial [Trifolium medium]|nr:hypothetical protein [Trifolium medium]
VQRVCHCGASPPPYRVPPRRLGGIKSEVEKLEQRLKDTTLREKRVVKEKRKLEVENMALSTKLQAFKSNDPDFSSLCFAVGILRNMSG